MHTKLPRIAIVGSLNMDLVVSMQRMPKQGETVKGEQFHTVPGGKGANQALACARLGGDAALIGAVGNDAFGSMMKEQMKANNVRTDTVATIQDAPTGIATIMHADHDNSIVIVEGANGSCTPAWIEHHAEIIRQAQVLLVQLEIPLASVREALQIARDSDVITVLNPAPYAELPEELLQLVDYITPNETEFECLSGELYVSEEELEAGMRQWGMEGPTLIVTRGGNGVSFLKDGSLQTIRAPQVEVVDTTGAGDCFNGAFSVAIAEGFDLAEAVAFGVKAATLSVTKFGAQAGMPTLDDVNTN
ncbi:ribokinase [Paenibacillus albus]|uniref:Ribokinase n=1 Tax=Paenibacillus albus TaxID=2495582 RepID=A0A3Q8X4J4_9BACL|nr:ribokinase [Paenibacillus albus]AZN40300.1 ribokinase [Paenibacillus albus]